MFLTPKNEGFGDFDNLQIHKGYPNKYFLVNGTLKSQIIIKHRNLISMKSREGKFPYTWESDAITIPMFRYVSHLSSFSDHTWKFSC